MLGKFQIQAVPGGSLSGQAAYDGNKIGKDLGGDTGPPWSMSQ